MWRWDRRVYATLALITFASPFAIGPVDERVDRDGAIVIRKGAGHLEALAGIFGELLGIGLHQQILEQPSEIGAFGIGGHAPIAGQHEFADAGQVEMGFEQAAEALLALILAEIRAGQRADGGFAQAVDVFLRVGRRRRAEQCARQLPAAVTRPP